MSQPTPKPYACHNRREFKPYAVVQDGWFMDGVTRTPKMVAVPFRLTPGCVYRTSDLGQADPRCTGCRWREAPV